MTQADSPYSLTSFVGLLANNFAVIFLLGLFFLLGFFGGSIWTENQYLRKGTTNTVAQAPSLDQAAAAPQGPTEDQLKQVPSLSDDDYVRGNPDADVILYEYSDFECPFCAQFHPSMNQLMEEYGDQVAWVYRHFPLTMIHPNAQKAAEASECVVKLGGKDMFWQFTDRIFEENTNLGGRLTPETATTIAGELGINQASFEDCLDSGEMAAKVEASLTGGSTAGVAGTPGTILMTRDGQVEFLNGALPYASLKATVEKYL